MSKPSDFSPERVLEFEHPIVTDNGAVKRNVLRLRLIGVALLLAGWAAVAAQHFGEPAMFIDTGVLVALGTYALVAAAHSRRTAVGFEKQLRMGLLVHNMELQNMAMQDDLTQLFNRRYFFDRLERELQTAQAFNRPLSVIVADLDTLKAVNDTYGHRVGDELLSEFAKFLLEQTRTSDVPARIGGDEFAVILPDTTEKAAAGLMARLSRRLQETEILKNSETGVKLTAEASFGMSGCPHGGNSVDDIMLKADAAMYAEKHAHKHNGRNGNGAIATGAPADAETP